MFKQPNNDYQHGFDLTFVNGWNISVKWGMDVGADPDRWLTTPDDEILVYKTAEVAACNGDDWWDFKNNMVIPDQETGVQRFVGSDQVADMIIVINNLYLDEFDEIPQGLVDDICQAIVNYYNKHRPSAPSTPLNPSGDHKTF